MPLRLSLKLSLGGQNTVAAQAAAVVIQSVVVGAEVGDQLPVDITADGASPSDPVSWSLIDAGDVSVAAGTFPWPGNIAVTAPAGLTGMYRMVISIDNGQPSNVVTSSAFALNTVVSLSVTDVTVSTYELVGDLMTIDLSSVSAGDWIVIPVVQNGITFEQIDSLTVGDGTTQTAANRLSQSPAGLARKQAVFKMQCPAEAAGNSAAKVDANLTGGDNDARTSCAVYACNVEPAVVSEVQGTTGNTSVADIATTAGNTLVVVGSSYASGAGTDDITATGFNKDFEINGASGRPHFYGSATGLATETRTISAAASDTTDCRVVQLTTA